MRYKYGKKVKFHENMESFLPDFKRIASQKIKPTLVVMDEVGFLIGENANSRKISNRLFKVCRNFDMSILTTDQRTADTPRSLTACARTRLWGRITEPRDLEYAKKYGVNPEILKTIPQFQFLVQKCW